MLNEGTQIFMIELRPMTQVYGGCHFEVPGFIVVIIHDLLRKDDRSYQSIDAIEDILKVKAPAWYQIAAR